MYFQICTFYYLLFLFYPVNGGGRKHIIPLCTLARLMDNYQEDMGDIPHWICLATALSGLDAFKVEKGNHGLFQIRSKEWCGVGYTKGGLCNVMCSELSGYNLQKQVECAQKVRDNYCYWVWEAWKKKCHGKALPSIRHCFDFKSNSTIQG